MLTPHMHACDKISHDHTYFFIGDLTDDGHAKAETCSKHTVNWQMIVADCAIFGFNAARNMENIKVVVMLSTSLLVVYELQHMDRS
jgi:hypothetical protein